MTYRLLALGLLGVTGAAVAATWTDFGAAFPGLPCNDGWAGCIVGDTVVSPGMVLDDANRPHPANMRLGFFDFDPLPALSPFSGLSAYTGAAEAAPAARPPRGQVAGRTPAPRDGARVAASPARTEPAVASADPAVAPAGAPAGAPRVGAKDTGTGEDPADAYASTRPEPVLAPSQAAVAPAAQPGSPEPVQAQPVQPVQPQSPPPPTVASANAPDDGGGLSAPMLVPPSSHSAPPPSPEPARPATQPADTTARTQPEPETPAVAMAPPPPPPAKPAPAGPATCDDLVSLEAPAMLGQLGVERRKCLEAALGATAKQTRKNKISRVLLSDAKARGDRKDWERLMKRHLEKIDRSDPNLCLTYAIHLSRGGVGRAYGVIRWADYALENKQQWSGATYKKNVYGLYKLRAQAANRLWQSAEKKFVDEHNDANEAKAVKYRGMAKDYSREWLDYARASGMDYKAPLSLCVSAAGNKEFCGG